MNKFQEEILKRTTKLSNLEIGERFYLEGVPYRIVGKYYSEKFKEVMTKILIDDRKNPDSNISGVLFGNVVVTKSLA